MTKDEEIAVLREEVKILRSAWRALVIEKCQVEAPASLLNPPWLSQERSPAQATPSFDPRSTKTSKWA